MCCLVKILYPPFLLMDPMLLGRCSLLLLHVLLVDCCSPGDERRAQDPPLCNSVVAAGTVVWQGLGMRGSPELLAATACLGGIDLQQRRHHLTPF